MIRYFFYVFLIAIPFTQGCNADKKQHDKKQTSFVYNNIKSAADSLAHKFIIVDGHIDLPYHIYKHPQNVSVSISNGHFDYPRAKKGGLDAPFMAIYTPSSYEKNGAKAFALSLISKIEGLSTNYPQKFALARTPDQIRENFKKGLISLPMGMENGSPIEGDINNLHLFFDKGIRYITLTHAKDNHICDSSYDDTRTWNGLSPFGYKLVKEMNKLGMMIDVSHITDSAFYQVMRTSKAPVIASHSGCRHFTPGMERNMSDDMIRKIGGHDGIIMANFGSYFLTEEAHTALMGIDEWLNKNNLDINDPQAQTHIKQIAKEVDIHGSVQDVANHIDRMVQLAGIDHVGIGSDFDGVGTLPVGLEDVSGYPNIIGELLKRGYSPEDIKKICSGNILRVWGKILAYSKVQNE